MEGCSTGILIDIDTEDNDDKCTFVVNTNITLPDFEKDSAEGFAAANKRYKSKSLSHPAKESKMNGDLFCSEALKLTNGLPRKNNSIPILKKAPDNLSRDNSNRIPNEDRWTDIINCDGDSLLENEKFDFSISLSDTSRTDDDVFYTQSEGSSGGRKIRSAVKTQTRKNIANKQIQRKIKENKEIFEDSLQNSSNETIASVNLIAKSEKTTKENMGERTPTGRSLVRQNTFTLSTEDGSLLKAKIQEANNQSNLESSPALDTQLSKSNILAESNKCLDTRSVNRNHLANKQFKPTHANYSSKYSFSKVTRLSSTKRSLKESELNNSSHNENQASKKSNFMSSSNTSSSDSRNSNSQSKIIGMNGRSFATKGKCLTRSHGKKPEPFKATLPVNQMAKSGLRPPTRCGVGTKPESRIGKVKATCAVLEPNQSRVPRQSKATSSSDSSISFTPQRRSLNTSAIPALTSTPNRRSTSNSSASSTPSLRPFIKASGLPTPIRLLNSSDIKI